jgi:hypothetical protein
MNAGRTLSTLSIWIATTILGGLLIASTRYTTSIPIDAPGVETPTGDVMGPMWQPVSEMMPDIWLITVGVLLLALLVFAAVATLAVWRGSGDERAALTVGAAESAKAKRDQQARLRRLLEQMDEREVAAALASLENPRADGDDTRDDAPMSVGELLQRRGGG